MEDRKNCIKETSHGEYDEKRSKFIALLAPARSEEEALSIIEAEKKKYYDARHHCYAYVIGKKRDNKKMSDDGEPSRTAGAPVMEIMDSVGLFNAVLVVTRYFGGIKLGTGGLSRAYREAARLALADADLIPVKPGETMKISLRYEDSGTFENYARNNSIFIKERSYTDKMDLSLIIPEEGMAGFRQFLKDLLQTDKIPDPENSVIYSEKTGEIF